MAYRIIYLEDLDPGSIIHDLEQFDFKVDHYVPKVFEETISEVLKYDLLLFDFRLTGADAIFDAPTIAQTLRTLNSKHHQDVPIILISSETKITDYYKDLTSQDLFDLSISKDTLLKNLDKYTSRFKGLIEGYNCIKDTGFDIDAALNINARQREILDYRIFEKLNTPIYSSDVFAFSSFILKEMIQSIGVLFGEDVLLARLGVSKESPDRTKLLTLFEDFKYKGIYSSSYNRWWSDGLIEWWDSKIKDKSSLRRLNADERVKKLIDLTGLDLKVQSKTEFAKSSKFWTICKDSSLPIDPIDGLEISKKNLLPWQETEYLSIQSGFNPIKFDSQKNPIYIKYLKPLALKRLKEIGKSI